MVKLTCIYTRSGDKGKTSLGNGARVFKSSLRIETIGTVDEANSCIGAALTYIDNDEIKKLLQTVQNNLFDVGADLCMPEPDINLDYKPLRIKQNQIDFIEESIDFYNQSLSPLVSFVLPGGSKSSSYLHLSRTIVRRAERQLCALQADDTESTLLLILGYLNRLSDLLFVLARFCNNAGKDDILWQPGKE